MVHSKLCAAVFASAILSMGLPLTSASAATITFETAAYGVYSANAPYNSPSVTENGYIYSPLSGYLFVNQFGHPGQDMEGYGALGGGVLDIVKSGGGAFSLSQFDYAAINTLNGGTQTLTVVGLLGGSTVATDVFHLTNSNNYSHWTLETPTNLSGQYIDELQFDLFGISNSDQYGYAAIDNVVLNTGTAVPEPLTLSLFSAGLAGAVVMRRRKAKA